MPASSLSKRSYIVDTFNSLIQLDSYSDRSTVCIIPTRGNVDVRVVNAWFKMLSPPNQKFARIFVSGGEVADSYNTAISDILKHPQLSRYKYVLTLEDDNIPPPDGLIKLFESMDAAAKNNEPLWALAGLYWSKGENMSIPIAFGNRDLEKWNMDCIDLNDEGVTKCLVIPQGFTLYRMDLFRKVSYPWFETGAHYDPGQAPIDQITAYSQDVFFFKKCFESHLDVGVRADVRVGHLDIETGFVW